MSIDMQMYKTIRQLYTVEQHSMRNIADKLGISRRTVRKYCKGAVIPDVEKTRTCSAPIRRLVETEVIAMLEKNKSMPRKQQLSLRDIWQYLVREKGVPVGYSTITQYVRELKSRTPEIFIPISHEPGESVQFDWGDMTAVISGTKTVVSVFVAAFPYSGYIVGFVYPDKSMISFLDAHIRTFEHICGIPRQCIYDNLRTAVKSGSGKHAEKQEQFIRLEAHYGFTPVFCNVAAGWEKGVVENAVSIVRRIAFTPMPYVESYAQLQEHVTNRCIQYARTHVIKGQENTIWDRFKDERSHMLMLPESPLDTGFIVKALVHTDLTVRYQDVRYSVPKYLAGREVTLRISPFHISIFYHGQEVYKHNRALKKNDHQYILDHYLEILERKPRAINHAVVLKQGIMPNECSDFLRLCREIDPKKQLVDILLLGRQVEKEQLLLAIAQANNTKSPSLNLVRMLLELKEPVKITDDLVVEHKGLEIYDSLITKGDDVSGNITK
ncbi:IS21 family transposase [Acetivibrio cellulolyticus]|uniref:IS21 family transposase n=1 Tax=Acetivibrio cellulolyticus TaxID=35830 RepID=UPI0001E2F5E9|nr:IS21 family transposase [Acetivibrio cellulolyticus]